MTNTELPSRRGIQLIAAFLLITFVGMSRDIIAVFIGLDVGPYLPLPGMIILMAGTALCLRALPADQLGKAVSPWLIVFTCVIAFGVVNGLFRENPGNELFFDAFTYSIVLCFAIIGRYDAHWEYLEKLVVVLFWFAILATVVGITIPRGPASAEEIESVALRGATRTVGYKLAGTLSLWPLIFALGLTSKRFSGWTVLELVVAPAYIVLQVYFQKRAPTVRALTYVAVLQSVLPILTTRAIKLRSVLVGVALAVVAIYVSTSAHFEALLDRYGVEDTSRFDEAAAMLSSLEGPDWLMGRGFGGYFLAPHTSERAFMLWEGKYISTYMHVGALFPLLKGGLMLTVAYYALFVFVLRPHRRAWYANRYNYAAAGILPVYLAFQSVEGPPTVAAPYEAVLVGLLVARGLRHAESAS